MAPFVLSAWDQTALFTPDLTRPYAVMALLVFVASSLFNG
ncbi:hypothetical protein NT05LI_3149 [Listeria ivanovii FSL F6-596]|nr:hypothetical protein NT05LI_3149 [Listeria ivanovii FSL F6-596]